MRGTFTASWPPARPPHRPRDPAASFNRR